MSGFESFESSDKWMNRFKNFLMEERNVSLTPERDSCLSPSPTFDLDKDFHQLLKEKCPSFKSSYDKENFEPIGNNFSKPTLGKTKLPYLNESLMPMSSTSENCLETTANDSFFYLEKICDKTVSDPNSTIHSYVENMRKNNSNSINSSNNTTNEDEENDAIERLLNECDIKEPERTIYHDQTQLGDIEAPSGLWETTVSDENLLQMSPTKRVGLLRPSTIIEEPNSSYSESENSKNNSSVFSFKTAQKSNETIYETANDTTRSEFVKTNDAKYKIFYKHEYSVNMKKSGKDSAFSDTVSSVEENITDSLDSGQFNSKNTLDDVSSILDDSLNQYSKNKSITKNSTNGSKNNFTAEKESYIEISDEEDICEESALNEGFSLHLIDDNNDVLDETISNGLNVSRVFNDTLEEVDYILQKGMKMMNNTPGHSIAIKNTTGNSATFNVYTPSPKKQSPKTPNTIISKQLGIQKNKTNIYDKNELFKKPIFPGGSRIPQSKTLFNVKKTNPYANIISPVGAYIKNTPKTPIINNIRETTVKSLDYDQMGKNVLPSRQHLNLKSNSKGYPTSLPKKAYQSANYVEIRDERVPLNIPGGNKIHKYLQSALVPAVVRHEGKMKIMKSSSIDGCSDDTSPMVNTTVDSSLADLSLMSGDVSLYTIRDAQNFGNNIEHKFK